MKFLFYWMVLKPVILNQEILKNRISYLKATTHFDIPLIDFQPMNIVLFSFSPKCFFFVNWISMYTWLNF